MSDKKRRDITLGEMQDECKRRNSDCMAHTNCEYRWYCDPILNATELDSITPLSNDLTDPPRFNEAQMALLKALRGLGFISIENIGSGGFKTTSEDGKTGLFMALLGIEYGETLDLAELLGKGGAE